MREPLKVPHRRNKWQKPQTHYPTAGGIANIISSSSRSAAGRCSTGTAEVPWGDVQKSAQQKECRIEEGHLLGDHVHMLISIRRSTRWRRWWALSRERAPSIWLATLEGGSVTSPGATSGRGDTTSQRWGVTKKSSGAISGSRQVEDKRVEQLKNVQRVKAAFRRLPAQNNRFERFTIPSLRLCRRSLTSSEVASSDRLSAVPRLLSHTFPLPGQPRRCLQPGPLLRHPLPQHPLPRHPLPRHRCCAFRFRSSLCSRSISFRGCLRSIGSICCRGIRCCR